jgi:hypothetical protein
MCGWFTIRTVVSATCCTQLTPHTVEFPITEGQINGNLLTYSALYLGPRCEARVDAELTVDASVTRLERSQTQSTCEGTALGQVTATKQP